MAFNKWAAFKLTEFIMCLICLIYKWITDEEASRLFYLLEKISREWPLLTNITWNRTGDMFADVTFGSYAIICLGLLISSCSGELGYMRKTETVLLGIGVLMFFGVGCMVLASIDSIPHNLVDNAVILGTLTLLTGLLFLLDMGVTGNRHKSGKGQDAEFRLKRNVQMPLAPSVPSESGVKKIDMPPDAIKPDGTYQNGAAAYQNGASAAYQNGASYQNAPATAGPINQNGFPVNQNGYQNALNQTVAAQADPALYSRAAAGGDALAGGYGVRNGIVEGRTAVTGVSYTGGVRPMGELRSSMKRREEARAEKDRSAALEGRSTPDGYRMRDDTVAKNEYIQMGKKYTSQDLDLNRELIRQEREKDNLELQNKYYDQRGEMDDYATDKTFVRRRDQDFSGRAADREPPRTHPHDGHNRRDKLTKQAGAPRLADSSDEDDRHDRELSRLAQRHRHYESSDYDDETVQQSKATRKLAQENLQRAHAENRRNYHRQRSADELHYGPAPYQAKLKRSRTPDFDHSQWRRREKEAADGKYYHSENEKDDHQEYLGKEKRSLQQWRFSQDLYQDNWRAQIAAQQEEEQAALNFPKHWKAAGGGQHYGVADIPPPSKFTDAAKLYKSEAPPRPNEPQYLPPPPPAKFNEAKYDAGRHEAKHEPKYEAGKYKSDSDEDSLAQVQIPSVSFLMSERGKKIKPTITPSPVKTITKEISPKDYHRDRDVMEDRITPQSASVTPKHKFFFSEEARGRDLAPAVPAPVTPGSPGFVKQLASNWPQ